MLNKLIEKYIKFFACNLSNVGAEQLREAFHHVAITAGDFAIEHAEFLCGKLEEFPGETFIGGCGKAVKVSEAFACVDCIAPFHRKCLLKHLSHPMSSVSLTAMPLKEALKKIK